MSEAPKQEEENTKASRRVTREPDSRRRHVRIQMPLVAVIDGKEHTVDDWSLSGLRLAHIEGLPGVGGRFRVKLTIPFDGFEFVIETTCELVWLDPETRAGGCRFIDLRQDQIELLRYLVEAYVSGRIATVDGLLATAGSPKRAGKNVKQIPGGTVAPAPVKRIWSKMVRVALYGVFLAVGATLAGLAGDSIYNRVFAVRSELAWVHGDVFALRAPSGGLAISGPPLLGAPVEKGEVLLEILDERLEGDIRLARAELERQQVELDGLRQQLVERSEFFSQYHRLAAIEIGRANARVEESRTALQVEQKKLERVTKLHAAGHAARSVLDEAQAAEALAGRNLSLAEADLAQAESNAAIAGSGYFFTGTRVEGGEPGEIKRQVRIAEESVRFFEAKIDALLARKNVLAIRSPCDCVLESSEVVPGGFVERGDLILELTPSDLGNELKALVLHEEAGKLKLGQEAEVQLADRDHPVHATVAGITRTPVGHEGSGRSPFVVERQRYAEVTIELSEDPGFVVNGLPATVVFPTPLFEDLAGYVSPAIDWWTKFFERSVRALSSVDLSLAIGRD